MRVIGVRKRLITICLLPITVLVRQRAEVLATTVSESGIDLGRDRSNRIVILEAIGRNAGWLTAARL